MIPGVVSELINDQQAVLAKTNDATAAIQFRFGDVVRTFAKNGFPRAAAQIKFDFMETRFNGADKKKRQFQSNTHLCSILI